MKHIRKRNDNRWEYRITKEGITKSVYAKTQKELLKKVKQLKPDKTIKNNITFLFLAKEWYTKFKQDIKSAYVYQLYINKYFQEKIFLKDISLITYQELQDFLLSIKGHRVAQYCYIIIKGVYNYALKMDYVKKDLSIILDKPKNKTIKGINFTLKEQALILANLDKCKIGKEILFYLLTGCRREEGTSITRENINFEKLNIFIDGTKTKSAKRYVPISKAYAEILEKDIGKMFTLKKNQYSTYFREYLISLGIKNKTLHDLRHTYSTNLYYLGVKDKERQYYMGHSSIVITNDIYTTLDPSITKEDILKLYNNLYPEF